MYPTLEVRSHVMLVLLMIANVKYDGGIASCHTLFLLSRSESASWEKFPVLSFGVVYFGLNRII